MVAVRGFGANANNTKNDIVIENSVDREVRDYCIHTQLMSYISVQAGLR